MATQAKPRRKVPRAVREGQMLEVARRTFGTRGYHDVSMDEIAEAVGISKPMLYAYFDSKEGLFLACMGQAATELVESIRRGVTEAPTPELRLFQGLLAVFDFVEESGESWRILYPYGPLSAGPFAAAAAGARDAMAGLLTELLTGNAVAEGVDEEVATETEPLAHALTGATIAMASWWLEHPSEPRELMVLRLMNFAWMGLGDLIEGRLWELPRDWSPPEERGKGEE